MTRADAIYELKNAAWLGTDHSRERIEEAVDIAIKALSKEPTSEKELNKAYTFGHNKGVKAYYNEQLCTVELPEAVFEYILSLVPTEETEQEPCDDAISRDAVLNAIEHEDKWLLAAKGHNGITEIAFSGLKARIDALPSVTQKSKTGHWIWCVGSHKCSNCEEYTCFSHKELLRYCPNCGAYMVEPQESEEQE